MQTCGTCMKNKKWKTQQILYVKMFGDFPWNIRGIFDRKEEKRDTVCTGVAVDFP